MRIPIIVSILITGNLLLGQTGVNSVSTSEFYTSGNESFAAPTVAHEQQLYAEQINNWAGQSHKKHHR